MRARHLLIPMILATSVACSSGIRTTTTAAPLAKPADLVSRHDSVDANGLYHNPVWFARLADRSRQYDPAKDCGFGAGLGVAPARPLVMRDTACTTQRALLVLNERTLLKPAAVGLACNETTEDGELQGHVNWFVVTGTGFLTRFTYERGSLKDHDYTFLLHLFDDPSALPGAHPADQLEVEFNADETVDAIDATLPPWWAGLVASAGESDDSARHYLSGSSAEKPLLAIATGVFGIDAIHDSHLEIHPVFTLAIRTAQIRDSKTGDIVEHWAFFVRNGGNEGMCSTGLAPFTPDSGDDATFSYRFTLPWAGGTGVSILHELAVPESVVTNSRAAAGPYLLAQPGAGLQIAFDLPTPKKGLSPTIIIGQFALRWEGSARSPLPPPPTLLPSPHREREEEEVEKSAEHLSASKRNTVLAARMKLRRDNAFVPAPDPERGFFPPPHDSDVHIGALVWKQMTRPSAVPVWRDSLPDAVPTAGICKGSIPGCTNAMRTTVVVGVERPFPTGTVRLFPYEVPYFLRIANAPVLGVRLGAGIEWVSGSLRRGQSRVTGVVSPDLVARGWYVPIFPEYFSRFNIHAGPDALISNRLRGGFHIGWSIRFFTGMGFSPALEWRHSFRPGPNFDDMGMSFRFQGFGL